ncbi:MAG: flagellar hook-associated protein FlgK [Kofleriaceae bacterium]
MSDLLSLLSLGSSGITAHNTGIAIATNNVANVDTLGYSRQRVDLASLPAAPLVGGVRSLGPERLASELLADRLRDATGGLGQASARASALRELEQRLTGDGPSVDARLTALFGRFSELAAAPTDPTLRAATVDGAHDLAAAIRRRAHDLDDAGVEADARLGDLAREAGGLATELAAANVAVARSPDDPTLADRRDLLARQLSALVGGQARIDGDGQLRYVLDGGAVLVDGELAAAFTTQRDATTGSLRVQLGSGAATRDVTGDLAGGALGGVVAFRDGPLATLRTELDQYAYELATAFNGVHRAGAGLDGVTGRDLFVPTATATGAAAAFAVDPGVAADATWLATAAAGAGPGDNQAALALRGLADSPVVAGGTRTPVDGYLAMIGALATASRAAQADAAQGELVTDHLGDLRDALAGVDLQEELASLSRFENTTRALTRFVATVDDLLRSMIQEL